jgi:hypothetical protein
MDQEPLGPGDGAGDSDDTDIETLTSEVLWNIAVGEEPCEDPTLALEARRFAALMMRQQSIPYREIAATLNVALSTAFSYVKGEIEKRIDETADQVRKLHLDRYNAMLAGVMDRATEGDSFAITSAMQIMGRIESLMGIEPPKKVEHTFGDAQRDNARAVLAKAIAARNAADGGSRDNQEPPATRH